MRELLQFVTRRVDGAEGKRQAVETLGWHEEIARQIGRWPSVGVERKIMEGQEDQREEPVERSRGCIELGQRVTRGVATLRRAGLDARELASATARVMVRRAVKAGGRTTGQS